jgi:hypothetical protein
MYIISYNEFHPEVNNGILHSASAFHVTGQDFQLYPAMEGHSQSTIEYHDDLRALHIEPINHQEVQILQGRSHPYVSKLEGIAATTELFKQRDRDATLMVRATERKHGDIIFTATSLFLPWLLSF